MKYVYTLGLLGVMFCLAGCSVNEPIETTDGNLTITPPPDATLAQGAKETQTILIQREKGKTEGTVKIKIEGLPKGVTVAESKSFEVPEGETSASFTLSAAEEAEPIANHEVKISAYYKDKKIGTSKFSVSVKPETLETKFKETTKEYEKAIATKLDKLDTQISQLSKTVKNQTKEASKTAQKRLEQLQQQYQDLKLRARKIAQASKEEWNEFQSDTNRAMEELEMGVTKAINEYRD